MFSISKSFLFRSLAIFVLVLSVVGYGASAQQADRPWREVRSIDMEEYGLSNLEGLAFSPDANAFLLWKADGSVAGIAMNEVPVDTQGLVVAAEDPQNIAFNASTDKLFVLGSNDTQLEEIPVDESGLPAPQATSVQKHNLDAVNLKAARGITFDPATGRMFVLNAAGDQLVTVAPSASSTFDGTAAVREGRVTRTDLASLGAVDLQSIAFNPQNGNVYFLDAGDQRLYEVTQFGSKVSEFDLSSLQITNPKNIVFAPSGDQTDDPNNQSLFILHESTITGSASPSSPQTTSADGQIVELSLVGPAAVPNGVPMLPATLIQTVDMSKNAWDPSSPDPSGIDYWPSKGRFLTTDSEVEEMAPYWAGANVFGATRSGTLLSTCTTFTSNPVGTARDNFSNEPTGIAINPANNRIYISDDSGGGKLNEINLGPDGEYCTADDTITKISFATDLEDVAYGNNTIFIAGGVDAEVWMFSLGANGVLGGGDDGPVSHFDTASLGFSDLEGIGYNADAGTLFFISTDNADKYLGESTTSGTLLRAYDLSFMTGTGGNLRSDVAWAPSSGNAAIKNIYIVSRGLDNNANPSENDGKWWEINIGKASTALTVTGITAANKVYDGTTTATLNTVSATLNGVKSGDNVTLVTTGATGAFVNATVGTGKTVNISGLTLSGADAGSYTLIQPTTTASITKAPLTVTADNKTKTAGQPDPAFTFTYSGFVNAETGAVIDTSPTCGVSGPHNTPGTYPIVCSGGVDINYSFTYVNSTLTVNPEIVPILHLDTTGVFRPSNGLLFLKNTNTSGFADVSINYGIPGDYPVVGDWDGNGTVTIGVYRNGTFYLRNSNTVGFAEIVFPFGQPGDQPIAGDWDGNGTDTVGVFRPSNGQFLLRNLNSAGSAHTIFFLGNVGDVGIAGDWDGDGMDTTGVFRPVNGIIFLKNTNTTGFADVALNYGIPGDMPVTGDWNGDETDTIGVYRNGRFYLRNSNTIGFADIVFDLGNPGDMPIAGDWDGHP